MPGNFYVKKTSDNPPFQPYYSNLHTISYQKMHIASLVQFMPKKNLPRWTVSNMTTLQYKPYLVKVSTKGMNEGAQIDQKQCSQLQEVVYSMIGKTGEINIQKILSVSKMEIFKKFAVAEFLGSNTCFLTKIS